MCGSGISVECLVACRVTTVLRTRSQLLLLLLLLLLLRSLHRTERMVHV